MAFGYYKSVTLAAAQAGSADSTDWPLAICLDGNVQAADADLKTVGNGGYVQSASGFDIRPYADSGLTTPLTFELVYYQATTGKLEMHVKIPTLSHTSDTVIYLAFGDAGLTTDGSSTSTWNSTYKNVYHLPNGSSLSANDSTATAANGTVHGATAAAGEMTGGAAFNGTTSDYINATQAAITYPVTLQVWAKLTSVTSSAGDQIGIAVVDKDALEEFWVGYLTITTGVATYRMVAQGSGNSVVTSNASLAVDTGWHKLDAVFTNSGSQTLYFDGSATGSTIGSGVTPANIDSTYISGLFYNTSNQYGPFAGSLDEARVVLAALSSSWITADYNSQKPSSTFVSWGSRTPVANTDLNATPGLWTWAGTSSPVVSQSVSATPGTWTWAGTQASIAAQSLAATPGTWTWAGTQASITGQSVNATPGTWTWAGAQASFSATSVGATPGSWSWAGAQASVEPQSLAATPGTWTWVGTQASFGAYTTLNATPGAWAWAGATASISAQQLNAAPGPWMWAGIHASISTPPPPPPSEPPSRRVVYCDLAPREILSCPRPDIIRLPRGDILPD